MSESIQSAPSVDEIARRVQQESAFITDIRYEMGRVVVGQEYLVDRLILGLLANGHLLLEGVPGLAKTLSVKTLATILKTGFSRIQFTPDLLPADVVGTLVYNPKEGTFETKTGPIFSNIILADEINRAPAKVQSALLEAMQERQVTIGDETFKLPYPFLVLATENPVEQEGTYPLPEAQVDRFMLKLKVDYPTIEEERKILETMAFTSVKIEPRPLVDIEAVTRARSIVDQIYIDDKVKDYILALVFATRDPEKYNLDIARYVRMGASPRATLNLTIASRAYAFIQGRGYVTPQDVKSIAPDVLRHRLMITYEAEADELTSDDIVQQMLNELPVP